MFKKRFSMAAVLCLALAALLPSSSSALTLAELTGTVANSSYTPVTITSATNKTITITATPLSFASNQWMYQVSWNRTKNAKGSLYVSLKSNNGTKVAAVATADQAGSTTFTALPSTAYRVEFYSQPNGKGSLLVRKYFTALAADKAVVGNYNPANYSSLYSGLTGVVTSGGNPATATPGATSGYTPSAQLILSLALPGQDQAINSSSGLDTPVEAISTKVGGPIPMNSSGLVVVRLAYQGNDGKCYMANRDGTFLLPTTNCSTLPKLPNSNSTVSLYDIPSVATPSFNWNAGGGQCAFWDKDQLTKQPFLNQAICGTMAGQPMPPTNFCATYPNDSTCAGVTQSAQKILDMIAAVGQTQNIGSTGGSDAEVESMSTRVGGPIPMNNSGLVVVRLAYKGNDGKCYLSNRDGTFLLPTTNCGNLPTLPNSNSTVSPYDIKPVATSNFNWLAGYGQCAFWDKDRTTGVPFLNQSICGTMAGQPMPVMNFCAAHPNDETCKGYVQSAQNILSLALPGQDQAINSSSGLDTPVEAISTKVGGPIPMNSSGLVVVRLAYQGNDGKCYMANRDGTFLLPTTNCSTLPKLPNSNSTVSLYDIPSVATPSFNWNAGGGQCAFWDKDQLTKQPFLNQAICGTMAGQPMPPTNFCATYPNDSTCAGVTQSAQKILDMIAAVGQTQNIGSTGGSDAEVESMSTRVGGPIPMNNSGLVVVRLAYKGNDGKCYLSNRDGTFLLPTTNCGNLPKLPNSNSTVSSSDIPAMATPSFNWIAGFSQCAFWDKDQMTKEPFLNQAICGTMAGQPMPPTNFCTVYPNDPTCKLPADAPSQVYYSVGQVIDPRQTYDYAGRAMSKSQFCATYPFQNCGDYYDSWYQTGAAPQTSSQTATGKACYAASDCSSGQACFGVSYGKAGTCQ